MIITQKQMDEIHSIQLSIFKNVINVCNQLDLTYFMVHGSLLGTVMQGKFIPLDDDIDIAMPRKDYERFLQEGPKLIDSRYFIQSDKSEKIYPMEFAKVRDNNTTYVVENIRHININHGIYIDIFPIDYSLESKWSKLKYKILNYRISCIYKTPSLTIFSKAKRLILRILLPSLKCAISRRNALIKSGSKGDSVHMTGGKGSELSMPATWFSDVKNMTFEGLTVCVPTEYDKYLSHIYGNYKNRTLVEDKAVGENCVKINACTLDIEKPFTNYLK